MGPELREAVSGRVIVLFDGRCGLCNGVVRFLMKRDVNGLFRYVPQESNLGYELMRLGGVDVGRGELADGVILLEGALGMRQRLWSRTEAVARALSLLGGGWALLGRMSLWLPRGLREGGYRLIARWRYRLFGRYAVCPVPTAGERALILGVGA